MKFTAVKSQLVTLKSRPARGGWIEILFVPKTLCLGARPAPHGAGGLKSAPASIFCEVVLSRPARGGWIEILVLVRLLVLFLVPPRTGRVD